MKTRTELEIVKNFIDNTYSRFGNMIMVNTEKPYDPNNPELGYCFKYSKINSDNTVNTIYKIVCSSIGIERTDFRVMMHEYGHIYLGHLDGIHEELDARVCDVLKNYRGELIDRVNKECGIDFADKLIERIIDDPVLNHSLHNIAMDMEVNSKILSTEDIEEMEMDITSVLPKYEEEYLKYIQDHCESEEQKKEIQKALDKMKNESKIKLIVPERYYLDKDTPFPTGLSYVEYLILIIKHPDQFIKMLVSIKNGGNGDTSNVSAQDVQNALGGSGSGSGDGDSSEGNSGSCNSSGSDGMKSLSDLMEEMGMSDNGSGSGKDSDSDKDSSGKSSGKKDINGDGGEDCPYKGVRDSIADELNKDGSPNGTHRDHGSESRKEADRKRELGEIRSSGGTGCSSSGKAEATRLVTEQDEIDMALDEVFNNFRSKVVKIDSKKDLLYLYNRGINRSVIAPVIKRKTTISTDPTIVFLIDISGSMDTNLVDRILNTIAKKMKKLGRGGLKYNIITWNTSLGEHIKDIDPRKKVPRISMGGGTRMAGGMQYFKENYSNDAILVLISDFEDYLQEWHEVEKDMPNYTMYGFNYGDHNYRQEFKYFKVRNFSND